MYIASAQELTTKLCSMEMLLVSELNVTTSGFAFLRVRRELTTNVMLKRVYFVRARLCVPALKQTFCKNPAIKSEPKTRFPNCARARHSPT